MFPSTFKRMQEDLVCLGRDFSIETRINAIEDLADLANNIDNASDLLKIPIGLSRIFQSLQTDYRESLDILKKYENFVSSSSSLEGSDNKKTKYFWRIFVEQFNNISTTKLHIEDDIDIEKLEKKENSENQADDLEDAALSEIHNVKLRLQLREPNEYPSLSSLLSQQKEGEGAASTSFSSFSFSPLHSLISHHLRLISLSCSFLNSFAQNHPLIQITLTKEGFVERLLGLLKDGGRRKEEEEEKETDMSSFSSDFISIRTAALSALSVICDQHKPAFKIFCEGGGFESVCDLILNGDDRSAYKGLFFLRKVMAYEANGLNGMIRVVEERKRWSDEKITEEEKRKKEEEERKKKEMEKILGKDVVSRIVLQDEREKEEKEKKEEEKKEKKEKKEKEGGKKEGKKSMEKEEECVCGLCGKNADNRCSRCHVVCYCSRDCQVKHYPTHKEQCVLLSKLQSKEGGITKIQEGGGGVVRGENTGNRLPSSSSSSSSPSSSVFLSYPFSSLFFPLPFPHRINEVIPLFFPPFLSSLDLFIEKSKEKGRRMGVKGLEEEGKEKKKEEKKEEGKEEKKKEEKKEEGKEEKKKEEKKEEGKEEKKKEEKKEEGKEEKKKEEKKEEGKEEKKKEGGKKEEEELDKYLSFTAECVDSFASILETLSQITKQPTLVPSDESIVASSSPSSSSSFSTSSSSFSTSSSSSSSPSPSSISSSSLSLSHLCVILKGAFEMLEKEIKTGERKRKREERKRREEDKEEEEKKKKLKNEVPLGEDVWEGDEEEEGNTDEERLEGIRSSLTSLRDIQKRLNDLK